MIYNKSFKSKFSEIIDDGGDETIDLGLYYDGKYVSSLIPKLEDVFIIKKGPNKKNETRYLVHLICPGVVDYGTKQIQYLDRIPYFEVFGCADGLISKTERNYHTAKLQEEAVCMKPKIIYEGISGLVKSDNGMLMIWGDEVIKKVDTSDIKLQSPLYHIRKKSNLSEETFPSFMNEQLPRYLSFWPGVTEPLFYIALYCITKLILVENKEDMGFLSLFVGAPGHLKTTLIRKYCLWTEDINNQITTFQDYTCNSKLISVIKKYAGNNFLADDLHAIASNYGKKKQANRLDEFSRVASSGVSCANIIVTGESLMDINCFSCLDRIIQIRIPRLKSEELQEKKFRIAELDDEFMPELARYYARQMILHYNSVLTDIRNFMIDGEANISKDADGTLRVARHAMYIKLTEFLFRKYCCNDSREMSSMEALYKALDKNQKLQEEELNKIREEQEHDYVLDLFNILNDKEKRYIDIEVDSQNYKGDNPHVCFYKERCCYLTRQAIQQCFIRFLNHAININLVVKQLQENGVLVQGNSSLYKRFAGKYHYVISMEMLRVYHYSKIHGEDLRIDRLLC